MYTFSNPLKTASATFLLLTAVLFLVFMIPSDKISIASAAPNSPTRNQIHPVFNSTQVELKFSELSSLIEENKKNIARLTELESKMKQLEMENSRLRTSLYDDSNVGISVYENIENYAEKYKYRWVKSCKWEGCRKETEEEIWKHLVGSILDAFKNEKTISAVQVGSSNQFSDFILKYFSLQNKFEVDFKVVSKQKIESKEGLKQIDSDPTDATALKVKESSVHILFMDLPLDQKPLLTDALPLWFEKVVINGIVFGVDYKVKTPQDESADTSVKDSVDNFIITSENYVGTGGFVSLAGSSSWYIQRRKVTLTDLLSGNVITKNSINTRQIKENTIVTGSHILPQVV
eukprot:snap_masked-scaffold_4-processed-gene-11.52-mRNA-1 protein AED:1.00 eAED:1.00 QI:0/0/0/0/1/1/2/0/346